MSHLDKINNSYNESLYNLIVNTDHVWTKSWAIKGYEQQNTKNMPYNGANQLVLFNRAVKSELKDPRWITFNEAIKNNTPIKKGSKGEFIGFFTNTANILKKDENGNPILKEGKKQYELVKLDHPVLKTYYVFNAQDADNIKPFKLPEFNVPDDKKYCDIDKMIKNYCSANSINLKEISSTKAFFRNGYESNDVVVPLKNQFNNIDEYYSTLFHELTHSTAKCIERTNKEKDHIDGNYFGSKNYAKEELVAELGALFMCQKFGLSGFADSKESNTLKSLSYLKSWLVSGDLEKSDLSVAMRDANRAVNKIVSYLEKEKSQVLSKDQYEKE